MTTFKNILTNRLGNLLAILNLLLIAFNSTGITSWLGWKTSGLIAFALNVPSHIIARVLSRIYFGTLLPSSQFIESYLNFYNAVFLISVFFQWLIIGYMTKIIAQILTKIRMK